MNTDNKAIIAAVQAAVVAYLNAEEEESRQNNNGGNGRQMNGWRLQGFQDFSNMRQQWQQRVGAHAGNPVNRRAYPLMNSLSR